VGERVRGELEETRLREVRGVEGGWAEGGEIGIGERVRVRLAGEEKGCGRGGRRWIVGAMGEGDVSRGGGIRGEGGWGGGRDGGVRERVGRRRGRGGHGGGCGV